MAVELPENVVVSKLDELANWCRKNSLWPMPFATACCGIELMATGASKHDLARFGAEVFRFSPRQCDLMIVAGRVVMKMLPVLQRIWQQMHEPKWCISMGACASTGGVFDTYCRRAGDRPLHPRRYVRSRLPAAARAVDPGDHRPAGQDSARRNDQRPRVRDAARQQPKRALVELPDATAARRDLRVGAIRSDQSEARACQNADDQSADTRRLESSLPATLPTSEFRGETRVVVPRDQAVRRAAVA